jgi:hypothetical protein
MLSATKELASLGNKLGLSSIDYAKDEHLVVFIFSGGI